MSKINKFPLETISLPAHWASALINGDYSGRTDEEQKAIDAFIAENPHFESCVDCTEYTEIATYAGLLMDCLIYTFPVRFYETRENGLHYLLVPCTTKSQPLKWQKEGLSFTASGYGKAIPTSKMIYLCGVWRRIYCTIYSNNGTCWIKSDGKKLIVDGSL